MTVLVHVSNVDINELWALEAKMSPVFAQAGVTEVLYSQTKEEPYISCNADQNRAFVTSKPVITVFGYKDVIARSVTDYDFHVKGSLGNDLNFALEKATGLTVIFV